MKLRKKILGWRSINSMIRSVMRFLHGREGERFVQGIRLWHRLRTRIVLQSKKQKIHRIMSRTEVKLWVDGEEAFDRIIRLVGRARHTIIIQMFIWRDDETGRKVATALLEAAHRGVSVFIIKDMTGDVFETDADFLTTSTEKEGFWKNFWSHPNIQVSYVNDNNHAKVYVIDGETLLITGMNIANSYRYEWHDYLVELRGNYFVERFLTEGELPARDGRVRLALNTPLVKEVRPELEKILKRAKRSILLEQSYFSDSRIIDILVDKSKEGVRVTVIVPATVPAFHSHANKAGIATLLSHGNRENIQVFRYPEFIHAKLTLIDRKIAFVGSANFYADSLDSMGEANVYIEGSYRVAVRKVRRILRKDILVSELVKEPPKLWLFEKFLAWLKL